MTPYHLWQENQSLTADLNTAVAAKLSLQNQVDQLRNDFTNRQAAHDREIKDLREQRGALDLEMRETRERLERQAAEHRQYEEQMLADAQEKHSRMWGYNPRLVPRPILKSWVFERSWEQGQYSPAFYKEIDVGFLSSVTNNIHIVS